MVMQFLCGRSDRADDLYAGAEVRGVNTGLETMQAVVQQEGPAVESLLEDLLP